MGQSTEVARTVLESINRQDPDGDQPYLADALEYVNPAVGTTDKHGWREFHTGAYAAFPDFHVEIERGIEAGDTAVLECRVTGTHQGEFAGLPATGKAFAVPAAFIVDVADGRVARWHTYLDVAALLRQLGTLPDAG